MGSESVNGADEFTVIFKTGSIDPQNQPKLAEQLLESRTQIGSETGYMMKFVGHSHSALTPFDIVSLPGQSYPVPESALESLPAHVIAKLEQAGAVQIVGEYDTDDSVYHDVVIAWEDQDEIDRVAELLAENDLSLHEAVDWVVVEESGRFTAAQWATIRNVTEKAVQSNLSAARRTLSPDDENAADE